MPRKDSRTAAAAPSERPAPHVGHAEVGQTEPVPAPSRGSTAPASAPDVAGWSLPRKIRLLTGASTWRTQAEPAVGLGAMTASDGPVGVRGADWDERATSLLLPSPTALAAAWDDDLVHALGRLLGEQARARGVHVLLAPTLNLHRSPLAGRHFECFAEDPWLTGRTGAAYVRGVQDAGVAATAKHYVGNDSESERLTVDVRIDERTLREVYLAPFEDVVAAGVWLVMAAYNRVNGTTMTASPLLAEPLKGAWGFDGVVISDWGAVRTGLQSATAAHDLVMPGPESPWSAGLLAAVRDGSVSRAAVDDKVRRLLRLAHRVSALDGAPPAQPPAMQPPLAPPSAPRPEPSEAAGSVPLASDGADAPRALLRRAVGASCVLLRNDGVLPLDARELRSLAVLGEHARSPRVQGGGSAEVFPASVVTPLAGIRAALPATTRLRYAPGPTPDDAPRPLGTTGVRNPRTGEPGVLLRVLDAAGFELHAEHRLSGRILEPPEPPGAHAVELSARLTAEESGSWTFGVGGHGALRLSVDERTLVEGEFTPHTDDPTTLHVHPPQHTGTAELVAGEPVLLTAYRRLDPGTGRPVVLTAAPHAPDPAHALAEAARAAAAADAAVVFVGTTERTESEGHDRTSLALPPGQDALVRAAVQANPRTVVVVNAGGPVEMAWHREPAAVLLSWLPGQQAGDGLADVLFGDREPGGRLPTTWPERLADAPVTRTQPTAGALEYTEGLHLGYRAWLRASARPAYWFGHGLGYTTWSYRTLRAQAPSTEDGGTVTVRVRNTGARRGREVVQLYLSRADSAVERPVRWLAGYAAVEADPGEEVAATVRLSRRSLRHWCVESGQWRLEEGWFTVHAGPSAGDLPLSVGLQVPPSEAGERANSAADRAG